MKKRIFIEILEEYDNVNIYSIRFEGETLSEYERFILTHRAQFKKDLGVLAYRLEKITESGVFDRHFRYEGYKKDRVSAIPSHLDTSNLRVYCICINERILILGNGGIKKTRTYNENPLLNKIVLTMQEIDNLIRAKEKFGKIIINDKNINGELYIDIDNKFVYET